MLKWILRVPVYLFCIIVLSTCIDPYTPHLDNYQKLLVVEGLITDEKVPYEVRLTRTYQAVDSIPETVDDALVYITDGDGNMTDMYYSGSGVYRTRSEEFTGVPGETYILHIQTSDGRKYESEPCVMEPVNAIDSVYYEKDELIDNITNKSLTGLRIYIDSNEVPAGNQYFRWEYEETWKFRPPYPQLFNYINETIIVKLDNVREYCWKSNNSTEIITGSVLTGEAGSIRRQPVLFIPSDQSDRLTIEYSLLIKQYSVSEKEHEFWKNLSAVNESGGNIFDKQPYSVISNIYNISDANEKVLGYFRVSAVKSKRIFIIPDYLIDMDLPNFDYKCKRYVVNPSFYMTPGQWGEPPTFDEIYGMFMYDGGFKFVEPIYLGDGTLQSLVFATNECSDCSLTGSISKPDFWTDLP